MRGRAMGHDATVLGVFRYLDDVLDAIRLAGESGLRIQTVFSPTASHEIQGALGLGPSPVRFFTLFGGMAGLTGGVALAIYTFVQWHFVTGGKPVPPFVPLVVVGFELTILVGFLSTLAGLLLNNRMPRIRLPNHYDSRFSEDRFGVALRCAEDRRDQAFSILRDAGAEEVHDIDG
jgi:hypothetical protein